MLRVIKLKMTISPHINSFHFLGFYTSCTETDHVLSRVFLLPCSSGLGIVSAERKQPKVNQQSHQEQQARFTKPSAEYWDTTHAL